MINLLISGRPILTEANSQVVSPTQLVFSIPANPPFSFLAVFRKPDQEIPPGMFGAVYIQLPGESEYKPLGFIANEKQSAIFKINLKTLAGGATASGPTTTTSSPGIGFFGGAGAGVDVDMMTDNAPMGGLGFGSGPVPAGGAPTLDPNAVVMVGISLEPQDNLPKLVETIKAQSAQQQQQQQQQQSSSTNTQSRNPLDPLSSSNLNSSSTTTNPAPFGAAGPTGSGPVIIPSTGSTPEFRLSVGQTKAVAQRIVTNAFNFLSSFTDTGRVSGDERVPLKTFHEWWRKFETKLDTDPTFLAR